MIKRINIKRLQLIVSLLLIISICMVSAGCVAKKIVPLSEGTQTLDMGELNLSKDGVSKIEQILAPRVNFSAYRTLASFEASLSKSTDIENFNLSFYGFDKNKKYIGTYLFQYKAAKKEITYTAPKEIDVIKLPSVYDENMDWSNVKSELKRLPIEKQIAKLDFPSYKLLVNFGTKLEKGTPIIDGSNGQNFSVLSFADYKKGKGGVSDGHTALIARLYDGVSVINENNILYRCKVANKNTLNGNKNAYMETDYRLHKDSLSFTRDYGETWIKSDLTADDISETLNFYKSQYTIPENSYYASSKPNGILAFFYGGKPTLSITKDNGKTWKKFLFKFNYADIQKPITHRIVGFTSNTEGYVGLGTDWSMGTGEAEFCYLTHDGGATWQEKKLPRCGTSLLLGGMAFCDSKTGVVSYSKAHSLDEVVPTLYFTNNGGNSWTEFEIPFNSITDKTYLFLSKVDSLTFENGTYTLTFSQNDNGKKVSFTSSNMQKWAFQKAWRAVTHITG